MIFPCRSDHQMRQYGKRHILEGDGGAVEQFQIISAVRTGKGCYRFRIKFGVICVPDAGSQFLFRIIGKKGLHYLVRHILIGHFRKFF